MAQRFSADVAVAAEVLKASDPDELGKRWAAFEEQVLSPGMQLPPTARAVSPFAPRLPYGSGAGTLLRLLLKVDAACAGSLFEIQCPLRKEGTGQESVLNSMLT